VLGALLIVAGIALVDSLNPATIGPALVLAVSAHPVRRVLEFTAGFFLVNLAGGVLLVIGPGQLLFSLIPHIRRHQGHLLELVGGLLLLLAAVACWLARDRLLRRDREVSEDKPRLRGGSAFLVGAGLALAELPTAFPYFAAVAAISAADVSLPSAILLVVVFNVLFVLPLLLIALAIGLFPSLRQTLIEPVRDWMTLHWPKVLAGVLAAGGVALVLVGALGLAGD
jgi:cytochrome c biogenesis protein CcdA